MTVEELRALREWAKTLTDDQISMVIGEARERGAAVAYYTVGELMTMTDGWSENLTREEVQVTLVLQP